MPTPMIAGARVRMPWPHFPELLPKMAKMPFHALTAGGYTAVRTRVHDV